MLFVKMLKNNEICLIDEGKSYIFDLGGRLKKEDAGLVGYVEGSVELPIISVLSSNNYTEVAVFKKGLAPEKYKAKTDAMTCAVQVKMNSKAIRMLRRDGTADKIRFNQLIFVYSEDTDLDAIVSKLDLERSV